MSAQTTAPPDPRVQQAIDSLRRAAEAINDLPDTGHAWEAKQAILKAVELLVRVRQEGP
jgi:hypothetical protein